MGIDVAKARADTPGVETVAHLNNAGASLPPRPVVDTMIEHLRLEATIGGYEAATARADALDAVYDSVAALVNARRDEIALTESATRAWQLAFYSIDLRPGDRILTSAAEYPSNAIAFLQRARATGARVEVVPDDESGALDVAALAATLDDDVKLVAVNHVPTCNGLVNPAEAVGELTRRHGALYLLDACQSVGQLPVDVEAIGCDLLSATGRKFLRGPRGAGFLYVSRRVVADIEPVVLDLDSAVWTAPDAYEIAAGARRFEAWECGVAGRLGLGVAAEYATGLGLAAIEERVTALASRLRAALGAVAGVRLHDRGARRCGIVVFSHPRRSAEQVVAALRERRINVWPTSPAAARFDPAGRDVPTAVRASVHYYNTEDEIDQVAAAVAAL